jgi:hypothetical protein
LKRSDFVSFTVQIRLTSHGGTPFCTMAARLGAGAAVGPARERRWEALTGKRSLVEGEAVLGEPRARLPPALGVDGRVVEAPVPVEQEQLGHVLSAQREAALYTFIIIMG